MRASRLPAFAVIILLAGTPAAAQQRPAPGVPLVRADAHATLGWFNANPEVPGRSNDWHNRSLYGGAGFGWYWTDHLKTEIEFGATTPDEIYSGEQIVVGSRPTFATFRQELITRKLVAAQQYQFFRNAWFHPHLAAGVDLSFHSVERTDDRVFVFDPATRQNRLVREGGVRSRTTSVDTRPFAAAGFKAYMTQRGFFRSDLKFVIGSGIDEVLWRFGFGVDF